MSPIFVSALIWLVLAVSLGAYNLMWILIDRIDATKVASLFYPGPPVTILMAWVAFGDKVQITLRSENGLQQCIYKIGEIIVN